MPLPFPRRWFPKRSLPALPFDLGLMLYVILRTIGNAAVTLLMTWGLFVFFFVAIGGFSLDGMMHHLANLADRYVAADAARTGQFKTILVRLHAALGVMIIFFRRHALCGRAAPAWSKAHD